MRFWEEGLVAGRRWGEAGAEALVVDVVKCKTEACGCLVCRANMSGCGNGMIGVCVCVCERERERWRGVFSQRDTWGKVGETSPTAIFVPSRGG